MPTSNPFTRRIKVSSIKEIMGPAAPIWPSRILFVTTSRIEIDQRSSFVHIPAKYHQQLFLATVVVCRWGLASTELEKRSKNSLEQLEFVSSWIIWFVRSVTLIVFLEASSYSDATPRSQLRQLQSRVARKPCNRRPQPNTTPCAFSATYKQDSGS